MQLDWDEHFDHIVIAAWQSFLSAQNQLGETWAKTKEIRPDLKYLSLREGGASAIYLHHFADVACRAKADWIPSSISITNSSRAPNSLREHANTFCKMLRTGQASR